MELRHGWRLLAIACGVFFFGTLGSFGQECRVTTTVRVRSDPGTSAVSLTSEQLTAKIGANPARVISVTNAQKPATIVLIDFSSSMKAEWQQSLEAAKQLTGGAGDRVGVVVFNYQIFDFANGREATNKLLERLATLKPRMDGTALYDTLIEVANSAKDPNTVLIFLSDGKDNESHNTPEQTIDLFLKNRWPPVFGLVLDYSDDEKRRGYFKKVVTETGGILAHPSSASGVAEAASQLWSTIDAPFTVVLQASQPVLKPEKLKIEMIGPNGNSGHRTEIVHVSMISGCDATAPPVTN
ncbi:VWA domain-containing protein [Telmatobacter sp. DSM 110680]|uniref:VWA domain-containing protein n=1 Tax=Telmatobacter sp. DSM 110680 TaxID=3036704 RepID=A0AAU7DCQ1_9BACT